MVAFINGMIRVRQLSDLSSSPLCGYRGCEVLPLARHFEAQSGSFCKGDNCFIGNLPCK